MPLSADRGLAYARALEEHTPLERPKHKLPPLKGKDHHSQGLDVEHEDTQKALERNYNIESVNPVEISKQVLMDCNYIKPKSEHVKTLRLGEGHLSMLPDQSIKEIYHSFYNK